MVRRYPSKIKEISFTVDFMKEGASEKLNNSNDEIVR